MTSDFKFESKPGETPLDDISGLIPKYVRTREALNRAEFYNVNKAVTKYFVGKAGAKKFLFNYAGLLTLHKEMFGEVWEWAGEIRTSTPNIGVPAVQVAAEIHRLIRDLHQWENEDLEPPKLTALLHHRLVWIHPFAGGNGRWSRMVVDLYVVKKGGNPLNWPAEQQMIQEAFRPEYIAALKAADLGNFEAMINLHQKYFK
jgi:Fic-DOC domain mobile mystery protein B